MTTKLKPDWAGEDWLSRLTNTLISTPPLYALMKQQARRVLIRTAEKNGIPWRQNYNLLEQSAVKTEMVAVENLAVDYPDYYQKPFHAYSEGNLCWQAAFEAESATHAMALRVWPQESLTWQAAQQRLRGSFHQVLEASGPRWVERILDLGCSVGLSTQALHDFYQSRQSIPVETTGLDLSPHMLSVARWRDQGRSIHAWIHAQAEKTPFDDNHFDLVALQFVIHELPQTAMHHIFREVYRVLKPDGCIAIVDNNPKSAVIQNLPPVLFTLMKSTEPWSDEYYTLDVEATLQSLNFHKIVTTASDPRHRTLLAFKPSA